MPSSTYPGDFDTDRSRTTLSTWPSPRGQRLGIPQIPAIRFARGNDFGASTVRILATACQFARPPARIRPVSQPSGTFTSRLPADRSPFPPLDMTTTVTGLLCWRDFHPQEWQLASLHGLPCCVRFPCVHAVATTPAQRLEVLLRSLRPSRVSLP